MENHILKVNENRRRGEKELSINDKTIEVDHKTLNRSSDRITLSKKNSLF